MIETTYVRLEKAAAMLETDVDTLLIAAIEGRIRLYGLLGQFVEAEKMAWEKGEDGQPFRYPFDQQKKWVTFFPIGRMEALDLLKTGLFVAGAISDPDEDGMYWEVSGYTEISNDIVCKNVFMKSSKVFEISSQKKSPDPDTEPDLRIHNGAETKKRDSLLVIIAALAHKAGINLQEKGAIKRIEGCVQVLGAKASNMTIRTILEKAEESIPEILELIPDAVKRRSASKSG